MDKYQIMMTEKAETDMEDIYYYILKESMEPEVALKQYNRIVNQILTLTDMPARIRVMDSEPEHTLQVRKLVFEEYYILFQIKGCKVIVLRVLHCKQDIEGKLFE